MADTIPADDSKRLLFALALLSHDLRAPLAAIRSNVSFLKMRIWELDKDSVDKKLTDILYDSERIQFQLMEVDILLGLTSRKPDLERIIFFRDVLIKSIRMMEPLLADRDISVSQIELNASKIKKIVVTADARNLRLVVFNLIHNSIMYARQDPKEYKLSIDMDENTDFYIIKFQDWGVGIDAEYEQKVFEEGFRSPEAVRNARGAGLGLAISKRVMTEMGGDLKLINRFNPTEFHMILPKKPILE